MTGLPEDALHHDFADGRKASPSTPPLPCGIRGIQSERKPTLLFEFVRLLFRFVFQTPAFVPLFQLPPDITQSISRRLPCCFVTISSHPAADHAAKLIDETR